MAKHCNPFKQIQQEGCGVLWVEGLTGRFDIVCGLIPIWDELWIWTLSSGQLAATRERLTGARHIEPYASGVVSWIYCQCSVISWRFDGLATSNGLYCWQTSSSDYAFHVKVLVTNCSAIVRCPRNRMLSCTLQTRPLPLPNNSVRKVVEPDWDQPTKTISQYKITTLSNFYSFRRQVFAAPSGHHGNLKIKSQKSCGARVHERYHGYDW